MHTRTEALLLLQLGVYPAIHSARFEVWLIGQLGRNGSGSLLKPGHCAQCALTVKLRFAYSIDSGDAAA